MMPLSCTSNEGKAKEMVRKFKKHWAESYIHVQKFGSGISLVARNLRLGSKMSEFYI